MFGALAKKIFGTGNERELKKIYPIVARINALEESIQRLSDDQLRQKLMSEAKKGKEKYDWNAIASQYAQVLGSVI
jgi:preprotein translocase subunit SecA